MAALTDSEKLELVQTLLDSVQLVTAAEVIHLASKLGLDVVETYKTISNSAGTSRTFDEVVPKILQLDNAKKSGKTLAESHQSLQKVLKVARDPATHFAAPLATVADQIMIGAIAQGHGKKNKSEIWRFWQALGGNDLTVKAETRPDIGDRLRSQNLPKPQRVAFIGLGSMGLGQANVLRNAGYDVIGYDNYEPCLDKFAETGGKCATNAKECAKDADVLVFMPVTLAQAESVLFNDGAIETLKKDAVIVLCSTSPPSDCRRLNKRIQDFCATMKFVDAPVSGGAVRSAKGDLVIMGSGEDSAIKKVFPILDAFASTLGNTSNLKLFSTGIGAGSSTKAMIQHLASTNAVAGAEAIAFAARLGLDPQEAYDMLVKNGAGFIFTNRLGRSVSGSDFVESKTEIMTKDANIVCQESAAVGLPAFMPAIAHVQLIQACASGWTFEDDASVIKVYTKLPGVNHVGLSSRK